jgi:hypothetical protein
MSVAPIFRARACRSAWRLNAMIRSAPSCWAARNRRWGSWHRWTPWAILAHAFLAAATGGPAHLPAARSPPLPRARVRALPDKQQISRQRKPQAHRRLAPRALYRLRGNCKAHRPGADECALSPVAHLQITGSAASGALMRAGDGRVDANIPGDLADRVRLRLRPGQDPLPTRASCHRRTGQPGSMGLPYSALGFAHRLPYEVSGAVCDRQGGTGG